MDIVSILSIVTAAVTLCSGIAALTPTPRDDQAIAWLYKMIDLVALNIGKAKDKNSASSEDA